MPRKLIVLVDIWYTSQVITAAWQAVLVLACMQRKSRKHHCRPQTRQKHKHGGAFVLRKED